MSNYDDEEYPGYTDRSSSGHADTLWSDNPLRQSVSATERSKKVKSTELTASVAKESKMKSKSIKKDDVDKINKNVSRVLSLRQDEPQYEPTSESEVHVSKELAILTTQSCFLKRHELTPDIIIRNEVRYFNPDGTVNPESFLYLGNSTLKYTKNEETKERDESYSVTVNENPEILKLRFEQSGAVDPLTDPKIFYNYKDVEMMPYDLDENDPTLIKANNMDLRDNRQARVQRIQYFSEIGPKLPNIDQAIESGAIMLDDDVVIFTCKCKDIEGLPSGEGFSLGAASSFISSVYSSLNISDAFDPMKLLEDAKSAATAPNAHKPGAINLSLLYNKSMKTMRFHVTIANAHMHLTAQERYLENIMATAVSMFGQVQTEASAMYGQSSYKYKTSSHFYCKDYNVPIKSQSFRNCIVFRESNVDYSLTSSVNRSGILDCSYALAILKKCASCQQCCVDEIRLHKNCCTKRCLVEWLVYLFNYSQTGIGTESNLVFNAKEDFVLGRDNKQVRKKFQTPELPVSVDYEEMPWLTCPWYACCYAGSEYRNIPPSKKTSSGKMDTDFKFKRSDSVVVEFDYIPLMHGVKAFKKLRMVLETNDDNIDTIHGDMRKLVSNIGFVQSATIREHHEKVAEMKKEEEDMEKMAEFRYLAAEKRAEKGVFNSSGYSSYSFGETYKDFKSKYFG